MDAQAKRPPAPARQSSTSTTASATPMSRSLSDGSARPALHKAQRHHVVGHGRVQRNTSLKNLPKLGKLQVRAMDDDRQRHHRRNHSGPPVSAPSSPRPGFKRNASTGAVIHRAAAHAPHAHAQIRKNHSSSQLPRQAHAKQALKPEKKRGLAPSMRSRDASPEPHPSVHFDVADDIDDDEDGEDEGWTEASASQSPNTTRSNTRSNSVVLDAHPPPEAPAEASRPPPTPRAPPQEPPQDPPRKPREQPAKEQAPPPEERSQQESPPEHILPDRTRHRPQTNGQAVEPSNAPTNGHLKEPPKAATNGQADGEGSHTHHRARVPDADMITSRLLQRSSSRRSLAQMSSFEATVTSTDSGRILGQSSGSTMVDTPGRELVSRFVDGGSSADTPRTKTSGFILSSNSPRSGTDLEAHRRNQSMPDFANAATTTPSTPHAQRSGIATPNPPIAKPSRNEQKLMLQRAASQMDQKYIPAVIPRAGQTAALLPTSTPLSVEGRLDPRLQHTFNHVATEYDVVCRYRNPLADAISRIQRIPGVVLRSSRSVRPGRVVSRPSSCPSSRPSSRSGSHPSSRPRSRSGSRPGSQLGHRAESTTNSTSTSFNDDQEPPRASTPGGAGAGSRRSRVSFELAADGARDDDRDPRANSRSRRQSFESDRVRRLGEAEEICRRMWEASAFVDTEGG